ncbi:MAG: bifunctional lysine ketoglutarate reductase /saccharopine dehydrogenase family protein [Myxococcota bacterium]|jgi:alpha-aminoadipic semialdehyde synthase|nr:bifunctional lysine ketoglutarate reductase /saccharopine dehydrogenase family protein [Myxococcota bacterium]
MREAVRIGIRREDKNCWERRAPLAPQHVEHLRVRHQLSFVVQSSTIRAFTDDEYAEAGARISDTLDDCDLVLAVKEIPSDFFSESKSYVFFSHTIKGQPYNMAMLQRLIDLRAQLVDYEPITDEKGRRLVFFGRYAGLAGMIDSLHGLGVRLHLEGFETPFAAVRPAHAYHDLADAKRSLRTLGQDLRAHLLPEALCPMVFGVLGYGNVSQGAQEIIDVFPHEQITPAELPALMARTEKPRDRIFKVVYREEDLVQRTDGKAFELEDYYRHPEHYRSCFEPHLQHISLLLNAIYWDERYPRFVPNAALQALFAEAKTPRLRMIGDVSCDIDGSVQATTKETDQDSPFLTFEPGRGASVDGLGNSGVNLLAVANLPCELPRDATVAFGEQLSPFVDALARADWSGTLEQAGLPEELQRATLLLRGELTPRYAQLQQHLDQHAARLAASGDAQSTKR